MFVDIHCHLDQEIFSSDIEEVVGRAKKEGVTAIINCGINVESNRKTLELSKKFPIIKPALGIYPSFAINMAEEEIDKEIDFIKSKKPFSISEVGLDFMKCGEMEKQKKVFQKFISLGEKLKVPLIVHSRKAEQEVFEMLQSSKLKKVVIHCYTGKLKLAKKMADAGLHFSIPPIINHSLQFQRLVDEISLKNLLTESDAPYLSPVKGERNEPVNVKLVVEKISKIRRLNFSEVEKIVFMNYQKIFS